MGRNFIEKRPMGRDGTKILQNHPISWDEKFLEVSHPMMGRKF